MFADAVITLFEDVFYPADLCGERACRVGADLLGSLTGLDVYEDLCSYYVPGAEDLAVCAALADRFAEPDLRLIRKAAAAMAASGAQIAPYADAREVFAFLQALDIPRGLIVDGPAHTQRLIVDQLRANLLFPHRVYTEDFSGEVPWMEALYYMSLQLDRPLSKTVLICANMDHACMAEGAALKVYCIQRSASSRFQSAPDMMASGIVGVNNLYDLPEMLGLVSWSSGGRIV
jgi:hypothetical protein